MDDFYHQIDNFKSNVGYVYYWQKFQPRSNDYNELKKLNLQHVKLLNEYDPMQLHGVKTDSELEIIAENWTKRELASNLEKTVSLYKVPINIKTADLEKIKHEIEQHPNFKSWYCNNK